MAASCLLRWPAGGLAAQMRAGLERETLYLGAQTVLVVEVVDASTSERPSVASVDGLQISAYGSPGVVRDLFSGSIRRRYQFLVNPSRTGTFEIPSVALGSGAAALKQGPFKLRVVEAPLKFVSAQLEPEDIRPGEKATLTLTYQGSPPKQGLALPAVKGLSIGQLGPPQHQVTRQEGMPIHIYRIEVSATDLGSHVIEGISLGGVAAQPVTLKVQPFVVVRTQVDEPSLAVGDSTLVHVVIRGLQRSAGVKLVAPAGLKIEPAPQEYQGPAGTTVFSFNITALEPGAPAITTMQFADGRQATLSKPITLAVRQSGEGGILEARGKARIGQTTVGDPFVVDYEVFFRGEFQAAGIDLSQAGFAGRPYVKVEPVNDLSYEGWSGQPIQVQFGAQDRAVVLSGSGELKGQKEQLLRFALKITPLAAGELDLNGVRAVLRLMVREQSRGPGAFFQSIRTQDYDRVIDVPSHQVVDPPGIRQPPGYNGAVGSSFTYSTALDRTTATAMAPLTLTMKITGEGVGPQLRPPPLAEIPELVRDFEISPNTGGGEVQDDTITFTQVIRPRSEAVKELPALPLIYYDYLRKKYETVYSLPIAISVAPGSLVGASAMQTHTAPAATPDAAPRFASAAESLSLGANYDTLGELPATELLSPMAVLAMLLAGPFLLLSVWAGRKGYERFRPQAALRAQRRQLILALARLEEGDNFHARLSELLQSYLRLTFHLPPGEVSSEMLRRAMDGRAPNGELRNQIEQLLTYCDQGRFASIPVEAAEKNRLTEQTRQMLAKLDKL